MESIDKTTYKLLSNPLHLQSMKATEDLKQDEQYSRDLRFYRRRILQVVRDITSKRIDNKSLGRSFEIFARECIESFKIEDTHDIIQSEHGCVPQSILKTETKLPALVDASSSSGISTSSATFSDSVELLGSRQTTIPTVDSFVIHKNPKTDATSFPQAKEIVLDAQSLRDKGVRRTKKRNVTFNI